MHVIAVFCSVAGFLSEQKSRGGAGKGNVLVVNVRFLVPLLVWHVTYTLRQTVTLVWSRKSGKWKQRETEMRYYSLCCEEIRSSCNFLNYTLD